MEVLGSRLKLLLLPWQRYKWRQASEKKKKKKEREMTETVRAEPAAVVAPEDPAIVEIKKRIENAFEIFDHESNKTVDVRSVVPYRTVHWF